MLIDYFKVDKVNYKNKNAKLDLVMNVINDPLLLTIDKGGLEIAGIVLMYLKHNAQKRFVDLYIKEIKYNYLKFLVFSNRLFGCLERYSSKGNLNFNAHLFGEQNKSLLFR